MTKIKVKIDKAKLSKFNIDDLSKLGVHSPKVLSICFLEETD